MYAGRLLNMGCDHGHSLRLHELFLSRLNSLMLADVIRKLTPRVIMFSFFLLLGLGCYDTRKKKT